MFDNPKRELARLQRELLEQDEPLMADVRSADSDATLEEMKALLQREDWEEEEREPLCRQYSDEEEELPSEEADEIQEPERKKKRKNGGLIFSILLEILGIIGLLLWWLLWT